MNRKDKQHAQMLEILKRLATYPIASVYPDGPCIERDDMEEILAVITDASSVEHDCPDSSRPAMDWHDRHFSY